MSTAEHKESDYNYNLETYKRGPENLSPRPLKRGHCPAVAGVSVWVNDKAGCASVGKMVNWIQILLLEGTD